MYMNIAWLRELKKRSWALNAMDVDSECGDWSKRWLNVSVISGRKKFKRKKQEEMMCWMK